MSSENSQSLGVHGRLQNVIAWASSQPLPAVVHQRQERSGTDMCVEDSILAEIVLITRIGRFVNALTLLRAAARLPVRRRFN